MALFVVSSFTAAALLSAQQFAQDRVIRAFRLLEWNVSDSAFLKQSVATRDILKHADADVFVFVQVAPNIDQSRIRAVLNGIRGPRDTTWSINMGTASNIEHTVIASRDSLRSIPEFARVVFDSGSTLAKRAAVPLDDSVTRSKGDVERVRTNGVLARVHNQWVAIVGIHLMCCGSADTWREYRRQLAAIAVRDALRDVVKSAPPYAIVAAGDLNLVTGRAALDTLLHSVRNVPPGPMLRADALHFDGWTDWTWDGRTTPFNGGRLDIVLYSSGRLAVTLARVWDTESMPADTLAAHQLTPGLSRTINQHRPVVVDFAFRR